VPRPPNPRPMRSLSSLPLCLPAVQYPRVGVQGLGATLHGDAHLRHVAGQARGGGEEGCPLCCCWRRRLCWALCATADRRPLEL
jgi:hypothetical protein